MNRLTRTLTTACLLSLLLFQSIGWQAGWHVAQMEVRREMQIALHSKAPRLTRFTLSQADFERFLIEEEEIVYEGKLYDIHSATPEGDSINIIALHDSREQDLLETLHCLLIHDASPARQPLPAQAWWARWTDTVFLAPPGMPLLAEAPVETRVEVFDYQAPVASAVPRHFSPPPEIQVG